MALTLPAPVAVGGASVAARRLDVAPVSRAWETGVGDEGQPLLRGCQPVEDELEGQVPEGAVDVGIVPGRPALSSRSCSSGCGGTTPESGCPAAPAARSPSPAATGPSTLSWSSGGVTAISSTILSYSSLFHCEKFTWCPPGTASDARLVEPQREVGSPLTLPPWPKRGRVVALLEAVDEIGRHGEGGVDALLLAAARRSPGRCRP